MVLDTDDLFQSGSPKYYLVMPSTAFFKWQTILLLRVQREAQQKNNPGRLLCTLPKLLAVRQLRRLGSGRKDTK